MKRLLNIGKPFFRALSLLAGLIIGLLAIKYGQIEQGYRILQRYPPDFTFGGWLKLLATMAASGFIFNALAPRHTEPRGFFEDSPNPLIPAVLSLLVFAMVLWLIYAVIYIPLQLRPIIDEGAIVEIMSELFLAATILIALYSLILVKHVPHARIGVIPATIPILMISIIAFVILMEEMSWGQHKFGFGTPDVFSGNAQNETNLHNFYTYRVDLVFYSTAFLVFILLPWLWPKNPNRYLSLISFYIPPAGLIFISAPICGLFFESWNTVPLQMVFYLGLLILIRCAMDVTRGKPSQRLWCGLLALLIFTSQVVFLIYGDEMGSKHALSEFREMLISGLMLTYTAWLAWKIHRAARTPNQCA